MKLIKYGLILSTVAALSACGGTTSNPYATGPKEQIGALTGAVIGGVVANDLAKGSDNQNLATMVGIFAGTLMGSSVGQSLDRMDRMMMQDANQKALETAKTNSSVEWVNPDSGNRGTITPTRTYSNGSGVCREFTQTIYIGGKSQQGYGTACRQSDGSWKIIQ